MLGFAVFTVILAILKEKKKRKEEGKKRERKGKRKL
jgi:hypothetical protein